MLENAKQNYQPARENVTERKEVQSHSDFEPLLDTEEAAKLLRMHPRTLRTKARTGFNPGVSRSESDGAFAPPRWIVGSGNSPAERIGS